MSTDFDNLSALTVQVFEIRWTLLTGGLTYRFDCTFRVNNVKATPTRTHLINGSNLVPTIVLTSESSGNILTLSSLFRFTAP